MWALWALSAWGDEPTGVVRVTVLDVEELPLAGARVQLGAVEVAANEHGEALFVGLREGRYEASASADGHRGAVMTGVLVHVNRVTPLTICMNAGAGEPSRTTHIERPIACGPECPPRECTEAEIRELLRFAGGRLAPNKDGTQR